MQTERAALREKFLETHPWARSLWRPAPGERRTLLWIILIHATAIAGVFLSPAPSTGIFLGALALTWLGGIGTTVCYHRALAHRALKLNRHLERVLTFLTVLNGSGTPLSWIANHRLHHAKSDTAEDVSSPAIGGFWWAHLRWLWQVKQSPASVYCPDLQAAGLGVWERLQPFILALSYLGGLAFGLAGFFWLGAFRLVFSLHAQCFVNSICHMGSGAPAGEDSSRNVPWLAAVHLLQGENWHRNHHAQPASARLGLRPLQVDAGWWVILALERCGLAAEVRRPRALSPVQRKSPAPARLLDERMPAEELQGT
ncbi:MAG TPA: fatty acid desaturase [Candidatus Saccharimonadales bacterium]|nr:fatty acid desaturase [Candidatus Saccharimonadales bacterium]